MQQIVISSQSHLISFCGIDRLQASENLLKEKKSTLEKAIDIARAAESTAVQLKVVSAESGLSDVKEKEQSENVSFVSSGWIKDCRLCGRNRERRSCPAFGQICAYCKKNNHFVADCPAKSKVSTVQERFYLSAAALETEVVRWRPSLYQKSLRPFQVMM